MKKSYSTHDCGLH